MAKEHVNDTEQPVQIKQRVIGAIVLVSLGVIFIPMLLNSERSLDDGMPVFGSNIPDKPEYISKPAQTNSQSTSSPIIIKSQADFESRVIIDERSGDAKNTGQKSVGQKKVVSKESKDSSTKTANSTKQAKKASAAKQIITAKAQPGAKQSVKAWAIQVGSFSDKSNAFKLRNKLRKSKFTAFVESVKTKKGQVYRVRVGPEIKRTEAEKVQKKLVARLKIKGLVVAHP